MRGGAGIGQNFDRQIRLIGRHRAMSRVLPGLMLERLRKRNDELEQEIELLRLAVFDVRDELVRSGMDHLAARLEEQIGHH